MNKQLIIIGIAVLFICVGLSGCINTNVNNFKDIHEHLAKYIGTEVTLEGYITTIMGKSLAQDGFQDTYTAELFPSSDIEQDYRYVITLQIPADINVYTGMYKITGIVKEWMLSLPMINVTNAVAI